jgi:hypothetical protein
MTQRNVAFFLYGCFFVLVFRVLLEFVEDDWLEFADEIVRQAK